MESKKEKWLESFSNRQTRRNYEGALKQFEDHIGKSIDDYLEGLEIKILFRDLKTFWSDKLKGKAPKTKSNRMNVAKLFFDENGKEIPKAEWAKFVRRKVGKVRAITMDKAGSKDDWRGILQHMARAQGRSLYMTLLSTGLRIGECLKVKIHDLELDANPARININPQYTKAGTGGRIVFLTDEAKEEIEHFLHWRKGRKMWNGKLYDDEPRLFPINTTSARATLVSACERVGLDHKDDESNRLLIHVHSTRKFFRSNAGLDDGLVHAIMGHEAYLDRSYLRQDPDRAGREFNKTAEPNLTFFKEAMNVEGVRRQTVIDSMKALNPDITDGQIQKALGIVGIEDITEGTPDQFSAFTKILGEQSTIKSEQKVIEIDEIQKYLDDGWLWRASINNEKALVERKPIKKVKGVG